jgi:hypothetical protein
MGRTFEVPAGLDALCASRCLCGVIPLRERRTAVKRLLAIALCVAASLGVSAGSAFAGEVKGPPGTPDNVNTTGALDHAHSACAASGLNDLDSDEGQNVSQVQTAADSWKYYGLPKGAPGTLGLCRGN